MERSEKTIVGTIKKFNIKKFVHNWKSFRIKGMKNRHEKNCINVNFEIYKDFSKNIENASDR